MRAAGTPAVSYWLTRFVILRLLGAVYAVAFFVAIRQLVPLIGEDGLTPVASSIERAPISARPGPPSPQSHRYFG